MSQSRDIRAAPREHDSEDIQQFAEEIRRFVRAELIPAEALVEEEDRIPQRIIQAMKQLGLFGMTIPESYGGLGFSMYEEVRIVFELCFAAPAFRSAVGSNNGIGSLGILIDGTEEQKRRYLPKIASGDLIASFCLTEPDAGSDAAAISTTAVRHGDCYRINGTKRFITNAPEAGLYTVFARTGPKESGADGISAFLVERSAPGISVGPPNKKMGLRGSHTADVIFEDCRVPLDALVGTKEGVGFKTAMKTLDHARLHMAAVAVGMSARLIDEGVRYTKERKQFGRPIAQFQLIQGMLADCETEAFAARAMVERTARAKDAGERITKESACCKYFATEALGRIADRVLQMHGGYGYIREYPVERLYRDARLLRLFEGTSQIQQIVIAREMVRDGK
ncbi:MAG: acyl-CoA dehydrogenase family protein [Acidobacteria bacterium]|nr:acyl-CoA dehydrogenase family protein [Acidobacteriota bacterium]